MPHLIVFVTRKRIHLLAAGIWIVAIIIQTPILYALAATPDGECYTNWSATGVIVEYISAGGVLLIVSILPSILIGIAYKRTTTTLNRNQSNRSKMLANSIRTNSTTSTTTTSSRNPKKVFFVCHLAHAVCSIPYNVFQVVAAVLIQELPYDDHINVFNVLGRIHPWLSLLFISNGFLNCFIYAGMDKGFRRFCKEPLPKRSRNIERLHLRRRTNEELRDDVFISSQDNTNL